MRRLRLRSVGSDIYSGGRGPLGVLMRITQLQHRVVSKTAAIHLACNKNRSTSPACDTLACGCVDSVPMAY